MYLHQLRLRNIACFEDITLDFTDDTGEPCRWIVILGENGTGKSTVLQALAGALPVNISANNDIVINLRRLLRTDREACVSRLVFATGEDDFEQMDSGLISVSWQALEKLTIVVRDTPHENKGFEQALLDVNVESGWFSAAYRPWRGGRRFVEISNGVNSYALAAPKIDRLSSLFDDYSKLTSIREWLADLDYRQLKEEGEMQAKSKAVLDLAVRAIRSVLPNPEVKFVAITPTKDVIFEENGLHVSIDSLSDGYRSAMSWIGDLTRRLIEAFPGKENPLEAQGVVLVDEIDLHLHPKWQRTIVSQIRKVFPNLQFIVTTHSPFIAQDMTENDKLIVLKREGDHVTVTEDKGFVSGWRADQILTSYLFGLESTRNTDIENAEAERSALLNREAQSGLSDEDRATLDRVNALLANKKSAPDEVISSTNGVTPKEELNAAAHALLDLMAKQLDKHDEAA